MARKGENIFKRKDGRWEARYIRGYELSGKIRYGYCYGRSYKEVKAKVIRYKAAVMAGIPTTATQNRHRIAFFCWEWFRLERTKVKESTLVKYHSVLTRHILPKLGDCFPLSFNTKLVEEFKQELLDEGLATKTVRDILAVLHAILKYTAGYFPGVFPNVEVRYPKEQKKEIRVLTEEEQQRLLLYLQTDMDMCRFGILLAFLTGLRLGELCALRWKNISLEDRTIRVSSTMQRIQDMSDTGVHKTKVIIGPPKTQTSIRTIPLTEAAARLCGQYNPHCPTAFLLTGTEKYMEPRQVQKRLARYVAACDLEGVHFHTIRHTFATRCAEVGFELKSLSEILGHANTSITLNRYVHSSMELKRENMNKLGPAWGL